MYFIVNYPALSAKLLLDLKFPLQDLDSILFWQSFGRQTRHPVLNNGLSWAKEHINLSLKTLLMNLFVGNQTASLVNHNKLLWKIIAGVICYQTQLSFSCENY